jgi:hypothetical protein
MAIDVELDAMKGSRDLKAAKQALGTAGYNGEKVVLVAATDTNGATGGRLRRDRNIVLEQMNPLGDIGILRFNHLNRPFDNPL